VAIRANPATIPVSVIRTASIATVGALTPKIAPKSVFVASVVLRRWAGERRRDG
jgi:hypothetical protein